jgi:hypothetical protein
MKVADKVQIKPAKQTRGKKVLAIMLRGGKLKGRTEDLMRLTRGAA